MPDSPPRFATSYDFENRVGVDLEDGERFRIDALLLAATGLIQDAADGQTIFLVENDAFQRSGTRDDRIVLPQHPVVSVASVLLDGNPITGWHVEGDAIVRKQSLQLWADGLDELGYGLGTPFLLGSSFGRPDQKLTITYTHGYETPPTTCSQICLEAVVRAWVNPGSVARESIGDTSTVYDNMRFSPTGLMLTDDERKAVRRIFGYRARSVALT